MMETGLIQEHMIARVRQLCREDERVVAAWMYGSFALGEGDAYSDVEFCVYLEDGAYDAFDPVQWVSQVAPVALYFVNEFGTGTAIFENLVRGEFHFERAADMAGVRDLKQTDGFPAAEAMLIYDRTGELTSHLRHISGPSPDRSAAEQVAWLFHSYLNWMLFGASVLARGERARALEILWFMQRYLLQFARVSERKTKHWLTPSRDVERDLSQAAYERYVACTATLNGCDLERAYRAAWEWGGELIRGLANQYDFDPQEALVRRLDKRFAEVF
jgi:lincosamide nucleotidyltransferase